MVHMTVVHISLLSQETVWKHDLNTNHLFCELMNNNLDITTLCKGTKSLLKSLCT